MTRCSGEPVGRAVQTSACGTRGREKSRATADAPLYQSGIPIELTPADPVQSARKLKRRTGARWRVSQAIWLTRLTGRALRVSHRARGSLFCGPGDGVGKELEHDASEGLNVLANDGIVVKDARIDHSD